VESFGVWRYFSSFWRPFIVDALSTILLGLLPVKIWRHIWIQRNRFYPHWVYVTLRSLLLHISRLSYVHALYLGGWNFRQYFFAIVYLSHPPPPCNILWRSSHGNPSVGGVKRNRGNKIERCHVWVHVWSWWASGPIKTLSCRICNTIFSDFCDHNVCAFTVSTLILLPVVNVSPKMDSATSIFYNYDVEILAVWCCFSPILAIFHCTCALSTVLLLHVENLTCFASRFPIKTRSFRAWIYGCTSCI